MLTASSRPALSPPLLGSQLSLGTRRVDLIARNLHPATRAGSDPLFRELRDTHFTAHRTAIREAVQEEERREERRRGEKETDIYVIKLTWLLIQVQGNQLIQEISLAQPLCPMLGPHPPNQEYSHISMHKVWCLTLRKHGDGLDREEVQGLRSWPRGTKCKSNQHGERRAKQRWFCTRGWKCL